MKMLRGQRKSSHNPSETNKICFGRLFFFAKFTLEAWNFLFVCSLVWELKRDVWTFVCLRARDGVSSETNFARLAAGLLKLILLVWLQGFCELLRWSLLQYVKDSRSTDCRVCWSVTVLLQFLPVCLLTVFPDCVCGKVSSNLRNARQPSLQAYRRKCSNTKFQLKKVNKNEKKETSTCNF